MSFGTRVLNGHPAITSTASAPPTPIATMPRPPALGVWLSVPIIIPPGNAYCSSTTWWMIPDPGFQNPMPYFALTERRNSYTSEFVSSAVLRSMSAPIRAWMRWSQCTVVGTATVGSLAKRELEQRHLRGRVLHRDPIRSVVAVVHAAFEPDRRRDRRRARTTPSPRTSAVAEPLADDREALGIPGVGLARRARWA